MELFVIIVLFLFGAAIVCLISEWVESFFEPDTFCVHCMEEVYYDKNTRQWYHSESILDSMHSVVPVREEIYP